MRMVDMGFREQRLLLWWYISNWWLVEKLEKYIYILFFSFPEHAFNTVRANKIENIWRTTTKKSHILPAPSAQPPPLSNSHTTVGHLLYLIKLHWHIIITQSPWFTLLFTLVAVNFMGFDKCIVTYIHNYSFM